MYGTRAHEIREHVMQEGRESRKHGEKEAHEVRKHIRHEVHRPLDRGVRNLADFKISMVSLMLPSLFLCKMKINNLHKKCLELQHLLVNQSFGFQRLIPEVK